MAGRPPIAFWRPSRSWPGSDIGAYARADSPDGDGRPRRTKRLSVLRGRLRTTRLRQRRVGRADRGRSRLADLARSTVPEGRGERAAGKLTESPDRGLVPSAAGERIDRKSTRLNSSHVAISYAVFCLKKKKIYTAAGRHSVPVRVRAARSQ